MQARDRRRAHLGASVLPWALGLLGACGSDSGHEQMVAVLDEVVARAPEENAYFGDAALRALRAQLAALPANAPAPSRAQIAYQLGEAALLAGELEEAIEVLEGAHALVPELRGAVPPRNLHQMIYMLGVAHLRRGEDANCCARSTPESCLFPIQGAGVHSDPSGSRAAVGYFEEVLRTARDGSEMQFKARWLLNLASMTLGEYPEGVPAEHLIPPTAFESEVEFPRFANVAQAAGLRNLSNLGGAVVDDFDGDHLFDVLTSSWDPSAPMRYWRNAGDGSFEDRSESAGLDGIRGGCNLVQADYDDDGDLDVYVLRGGWFFGYGAHPNSLLANDGTGQFRDLTFEAGLGEDRYPTQTAGWADYDNDGDLDLYVGNESTAQVDAPSQLYANDGAGGFVDVAGTAGVKNDRFTKGVSWGDYDADGWMDLYVSNYQGENRLYHSEGGERFRDVARQKGVAQPLDSFPTWWWDFDDDGRLDLFVGSYAGGIADVAASYLGQSFAAELPKLYKQLPDGRFRDVASRRGLVRPALPMGANYGDLDNDGRLDFYLGTGWPMFDELMPNVMYANQGARFADVTVAGGFGHLQKGHAIAFADLDGDGDQDVFAQMGGAYPRDQAYDALWANPGFGHHWIGLLLEGRSSNRSAIGARVELVLDGEQGERRLHRTVGSGGSFGAHPLRLTIGLGTSERIERIEVRWPGAEDVQVIEQPPIDQHLRLVQGEPALEPLELPRFSLGSAD